MRVVLDSNVFVSATLFRRGAAFDLLQAVRRGALQLLVPDGQTAELQEVLSRPAFKHRYALTMDQVADLLEFLRDFGAATASELAPPVSVRDPDDIPILAAALAGQADYLVTGDKDLLTLADEPRIAPLRIVTIRELLTVLADA